MTDDPVAEARRLRERCGDSIWMSQWGRYDGAFDALVALVERLVKERNYNAGLITEMQRSSAALILHLTSERDAAYVDRDTAHAHLKQVTDTARLEVERLRAELAALTDKGPA